MSFEKSSAQSATTAMFAGTVWSSRCTSRNCQLDGSGGITNDDSIDRIARHTGAPTHTNRDEAGLSDPRAWAKSARTITRPIPEGNIYLAINMGAIRYESTNKISGADNSKYPASSKALFGPR